MYWSDLNDFKDLLTLKLEIKHARKIPFINFVLSDDTFEAFICICITLNPRQEKPKKIIPKNKIYNIYDI